MSLLGDLDRVAGVHRGTTSGGEVYYWIYTDEYESAECNACRAGTCLQKVYFGCNDDGSVDVADRVIVHNCRKELS